MITVNVLSILILFQLARILWASLLKVSGELYKTSRTKAQLVSKKTDLY